MELTWRTRNAFYGERRYLVEFGAKGNTYVSYVMAHFNVYEIR